MTVTQAPAGYRDWERIRCPEPPPSRYRYDELLLQAQAMLKARESNFPLMVMRHEMKGEEAEAELATFRALVADLDWIIATGAGEDKGPPPIDEAMRGRICAALDESIKVLSAMFAEAGNPVPVKLSDQAHDVIALRWIYDAARGRIGSLGEMHGTALLNFKHRNQQQGKDGQ